MLSLYNTYDDTWCFNSSTRLRQWSPIYLGEFTQFIHYSDGCLVEMFLSCGLLSIHCLFTLIRFSPFPIYRVLIPSVMHQELMLGKTLSLKLFTLVMVNFFIFWTDKLRYVLFTWGLLELTLTSQYSVCYCQQMLCGYLNNAQGHYLVNHQWRVIQYVFPRGDYLLLPLIMNLRKLLMIKSLK